MIFTKSVIIIFMHICIPYVICATSFDYSCADLRNIPKEITDSSEELQELNLSFNEITSLEGIESLVLLKKLDLSFNEIASLEGIESLVLLEKLDLQKNKLTLLQDTIGDLVHLIRLNLNGNSLTLLPSSIRNLSRNIKTLDLRNNPLMERGKHGMLGWKDLKEIFDGNLLVSNDATELFVKAPNQKIHGRLTRHSYIIIYSTAVVLGAVFAIIFKF